MVASLLDELKDWRALVEERLAGYVASHVDFDGARPPARLADAMGHALLAGGKRLRPLVVFAVNDALGGGVDDAVPAAVALELVHTYSLVHDDLPALDNDDLRRGRPTVHKAFDDATAILAGDALLTDAFAVLSAARHHAGAQVRELALAAGSAAMVGGQYDDIAAEGRAASTTSELDLRAIHRRKTGRLFGGAAALGALAANRADVVDDARAFGLALGFAFQVQDDVLDVEGDVALGGKTRGRDEKHDKLTYVRLLGLDGAKDLAARAAKDAVDAALRLQPQGDRLVRLARFAATRTY